MVPFARASCSVGKASFTAVIEGKAIVGGRCVNSGSSDAAALREFWMRTALQAGSDESRYGSPRLTHSIRTSAAIASTIGTARATTHGS